MNSTRAGRWVAPVVAGVLLIPIAACSTNGNAADQTAAKAAKAADAAATITPANGGKKVRPDKGVQVTAAGGVLDQVTRAGRRTHRRGRAVGGQEELAHEVDAQARHDLHGDRDRQERRRKATTTTSKFTTMKARATVQVSDVTPQPRETVGVGMPITVNFDGPVANRDAVERALEVRSTTPVEGAWHWVTGQQVIFRHQVVLAGPHLGLSLVAHMSGVRAAAGTCTAPRTHPLVQGRRLAHREGEPQDRQGARSTSTASSPRPSRSAGAWAAPTPTATTSARPSGVHLAMGKFSRSVVHLAQHQEGRAGLLPRAGL